MSDATDYPWQISYLEENMHYANITYLHPSYGGYFTIVSALESDLARYIVDLHNKKFEDACQQS